VARPNQLWTARLQIHRLSRWIDGIETEFPVSFAQMTENEQLMVATILKQICQELDDYHETMGMPSASAICVVRPMQEEIKIVEMKEPKVN
jgi:hypothetical protein